MTYHRLSRANDAAGIVPTVFAIDKHGKHDRRSFAKSADQIPAQTKPIRLEQSKLQQGPLRHPDFLEWSSDGSPFGYFIVVSPRVHALLGLASLPAHTVHEAVVQWPKDSHREHGRGEFPYFVYAFDQVRSLEAFDLSATSLSCTVRLLSERMTHHMHLPAGAVSSGADAWRAAEEWCPSDQRPWVLPTALLAAVDDKFQPQIDFASGYFPIALRDVDVVLLDQSYDVWVSDGLRDALVAIQATGFDFPECWDETKLRVSESADRSARASRMLLQAQKHAGPPTSDPLFDKYLARRTEVLTRRDRVREKRGAATDDIGKVEEKLDVEFPAEYRAALADEALPTTGRYYFYELEDLRTIEDIDADWTALSAPQAVRALLVAVDDGGDYLGYILDPESMTVLSAALMHFDHETTAVTPSKYRLKLRNTTEE